MLEKRIMGYFNKLTPSYEALTANTIFNTDTNSVEVFSPNDPDNDEDCREWLAPGDEDRFFPTLEDAKNALFDYKRGLIARMPEMKFYLTAMLNLSQPTDKNDPLYFKREDYLPYPYLECHQGNYYSEECNRLDKENRLLIQAATRKTLSISADTFIIEDVKNVKWGKKHAELNLANGRSVLTTQKFEFNVVSYLFGKNLSNSTYPRLDQ